MKNLRFRWPLKTAIDQEEELFRLINIEYLEVSTTQYYDIFYKSSAFGTTRFVKFASSHPSHKGKVRKLIESGENKQEFFIREEDLVKYHQQATQSLRKVITSSHNSLKEKTEKIYDVSKEVMDVYDALTTRRSYKKALKPFDAITLMEKRMGGEFDQKILGNFICYLGPDL